MYRGIAIVNGGYQYVILRQWWQRDRIGTKGSEYNVIRQTPFVPARMMVVPANPMKRR
jgi:hypothetical protein